MASREGFEWSLTAMGLILKWSYHYPISALPVDLTWTGCYVRELGQLPMGHCQNTWNLQDLKPTHCTNLIPIPWCSVQFCWAAL